MRQESPENAKLLYAYKLLQEGQMEKIKDEVAGMAQMAEGWARYMDARKMTMIVYCQKNHADLKALENAYIELANIDGNTGSRWRVLAMDEVEPYLDDLIASRAKTAQEYVLINGFQPDEALSTYHHYWESRRMENG